MDHPWWCNSQCVSILPHTHSTLLTIDYCLAAIWEDNIEVDLQEVGCGSMDWIQLAQDRYRWRAVVNTVMNFRVP
jgi:hypothetical protein